MHTYEMPRVFLTIAAFAALGASPGPVRADQLEGLDQTMQVIDDVAGLDKAAAYFKVPEEEADAAPSPEVADNEAIDSAGFDDDFEHDVEFEEELLLDEDDFEDGDDVDDDRIDAVDDGAL